MKGYFKNTSELIKKARIEKEISQTEAAKLLGYKNGQIISNIERGLQGVPLGRASEFCHKLRLNPDMLKAHLVQDFKESIDTIF
jgi:DNA-binding XRE family transcriptional regulator